MVNASNLASVAGAAAGAAAGASLGLEGAAGQVAGARIRRAAARAAAAKPKAQDGVQSLLRQLSAVLRASSTVMPRGGRVGVPGWAPPAPRTGASSTSSTSSSKSALSFLSDPKLSIEEKLIRLMAYLNDKYEKEMQAKMNQIAGKNSTAASSSTKKSKGILGSIGSALSSALGKDAMKSVAGFLKLPGVKSVLGKIAGPVLAAGASALGFPAAAPALLAFGPKVVDAVAGIRSAGASSSSSATSAASAGADGAGGSDEKMLMMDIQRLMDKQKEMFSMVSNILKASHDTRMAAIGNIR